MIGFLSSPRRTSTAAHRIGSQSTTTPDGLAPRLRTDSGSASSVEAPHPGGAEGAVVAAQELYRALVARGVQRVYGMVDARVSVVSLPGVTVWCRGGVLSWRDELGRCVQIFATEVEHAVRLLLETPAPAGAHHRRVQAAA